MIKPDFGKAKNYALQRLKQDLPPKLYYHSLGHTRDDVLPAVETLAGMEGIQGELLSLLLTAAWFHDLGFVETRAGHEAVSIRIASEILPDFGYDNSQIKIVRGIINATALPQSPRTLLEQIMADADMDMLGDDDFKVRNANLRRELAFYEDEFTDREWYREQIKFLESHSYFTASARRLRDRGKLRNIEKLKKKLVALR